MKMTDSTIRVLPKISSRTIGILFTICSWGGQCVDNNHSFLWYIDFTHTFSIIKSGVESLCQLISCSLQGVHHGAVPRFILTYAME